MTRAERIAHEIIALTAQKPAIVTISELARRFGVGRRTISSALAIARKKAPVHSKMGRGIALGTKTGNADAPSSAGPSPAARHLAARLKRRIEQGLLKSETTMPKSSYITRYEHVSATTCREALLILQNEKLVHKRGNRWIVGPSPRKRPGHLAVHAACPIVIFHLTHENFWNRISTEKTFVWPFFESLMTQLRRHGIQWRVCVNQGDTASMHPGGKEKIRELIESLGARYAGTLYFTQSIDAESERDISEWIRWYARYKRTLVLFDAMIRPGGFGKFNRSFFDGYRRFFRCYLDEPRGVRLLLDTLYELGHRRIGYPVFEQRGIQRRGAQLQAFLKEYPEPVTSIMADCTKDYDVPRGIVTMPVSSFVVARIQEARARISARVAPGKGVRRHGPAHLREWIPGLMRMLDRNVTALVLFNDALAMLTRFWLRHLGVDMPRRLSLVSFDNNPTVSPHPLSTIDFGLDDLGERAAHLYIRDIPIRADDRQGNMCSRPELIDRGSLGPPRKGALRPA